MVADGLGHGVHAAEASRAAVSHLGESRLSSPADVLQAAHLRLKATRGAAASLAEMDRVLGTVTFAGIGNVSGAIISAADSSGKWSR